MAAGGLTAAPVSPTGAGFKSSRFATRRLPIADRGLEVVRHDEPRIQYATTSDGVSIAFWELGAGVPH
jgi:hypothetical protein